MSTFPVGGIGEAAADVVTVVVAADAADADVQAEAVDMAADAGMEAEDAGAREFSVFPRCSFLWIPVYVGTIHTPAVL